MTVKKRNKKYNPNRMKQHQHNIINRRHYLDFKFCLEDWLKFASDENDSVADDGTPLIDLVKFEGSLLPAVQQGFIDTTQVYELIVRMCFYDEEQQSIVDIWNFTDEGTGIILKMPFFDLFNGSESVYIDRGEGIKTRWKGVVDECVLLQARELEKGGLRHVETMICVCTQAKFKNYQAFKQTQIGGYAINRNKLIEKMQKAEIAA